MPRQAMIKTLAPLLVAVMLAAIAGVSAGQAAGPSQPWCIGAMLMRGPCPVQLSDLTSGGETGHAEPSPTDAIVDLANAARRDGASCGAYPPRWDEHDYQPGARALTIDADLTDSAQAHAEYMAASGDYRHQTADAIVAAGGMAENIAWIGPFTLFASDGTASTFPEEESKVPPRFVQQWLDSPGHCHNMLKPQWGKIGVGVAISTGGDWYGVQIFSK